MGRSDLHGQPALSRHSDFRNGGGSRTEFLDLPWNLLHWRRIRIFKPAGQTVEGHPKCIHEQLQLGAVHLGAVHAALGRARFASGEQLPGRDEKAEETKEQVQSDIGDCGVFYTHEEKQHKCSWALTE